jgi:hypothetical protein
MILTEFTKYADRNPLFLNKVLLRTTLLYFKGQESFENTRPSPSNHHQDILKVPNQAFS